MSLFYFILFYLLSFVISMTYYLKHLLTILTLARIIILTIPGQFIEQSSLIRIFVNFM